MPNKCEWPILRDALRTFVRAEQGTQGSAHIRPLHWYVACRLVLEGGLDPDNITPRPPFVVELKGGRRLLRHDPDQGGSGEQTVLGGLKTKDVDVVVMNKVVGPALAVSLKGTLNAFRNLTNRMEEAVGDCTNLHLTYPALAYGFWHVLRANREGALGAHTPESIVPDPHGNVKKADVSLLATGEMADGIIRYHDALCGLADRNSTRDTATRYEAIALTLIDPDEPSDGEIVAAYPQADSPLLFENFFAKLYRAYDERFIYAAPAISKNTERVEWDPESQVLTDDRIADYNPRIAG